MSDLNLIWLFEIKKFKDKFKIELLVQHAKLGISLLITQISDWKKDLIRQIQFFYLENATFEITKDYENRLQGYKD